MKFDRLHPLERIDTAFADRPTIDQYLLLSMLLHVFLLVALGDTRGGESRGGARGFGSILVSLTGPPVDERLTVRAASARRSEPRTDSREATRTPAPSAPAVTAPAEPRPAQAPPAESPPVPTPPTPVPLAVPSALERIEAPKVEREFTAAPLPTSAVRTEALAPLPAVAAPTPAATFVEAPAVPESLKLPAPLSPITPARVESQLAAPVQLKPADRPLLAPLPRVDNPVVKSTLAPAPAASAERIVAPAPLPRVAEPVIGQFASPADSKALETPSALAQPLVPMAPIAPARLANEFAAPAEIKPSDVPVEVPRAMEKISAPVVEKEFAPYVERTSPAAPSTVPPAGTARAMPEPSRVTPDNASASGARGDPTLPTFSGPSPATPKLDLDSIKDRARTLARQGTGPRTAIPFFTAPPPPTKKDVEKAFDKALQRPECKDAYADMGLAAVVPLLRDALTEKGCKW